MTLLSAEKIKEELPSLAHWKLEGKELVRHAEFADFAAAMAFVNKVAAAAEKANHHPDIDIRYNQVKLALTSHDAGGLTGRDVKMAREISTLL
jgi:4a-hydroxytetrahydrobiopterin dehydratase